ncbi:hypothetical protein ACHQM5_016233 [Ranunculus cassubicifolius]
MSAFGGDSWGREAQYRKRRVDDLMLDQLNDSYKKLSNGKYVCLICSNNPLFDSSLTLSMHSKGSRHVAAESRLKEREFKRQEELKKRIALSHASVSSVQHFDRNVDAVSAGKSKQEANLKGKPLIERTLKAAAEALSCQRPDKKVVDGQCNVKRKNTYFFSPVSSSIPEKRTKTSQSIVYGASCLNVQTTEFVSEASTKMLAEHRVEIEERRERELKFIAAGWKRDCNGTWYRDVDAEFDSDEEDPNICFS